MSKFVFIYAFFYAFNCFGAVPPTGTTLPAPASPSTNIATETATASASATSMALSLIPPTPATASVSFPDGSSALSSSAMTNIQIAMKEAELRGKIAEVQVLAWGDGAASPKDTAAATDVSLATQRGLAVTSFVRAGNPDVNIKNVNVAQSPTALQALLADPKIGARSPLGNIGVFDPETAVTHPQAVVLVIVH